MAVTLAIDELRGALRLGDSVEESAELRRLLAFCTLAVEKHAPDAPDLAHNEAAVRLAGYLFDQPTAGRGMAYANALRFSGAQAMLLPWREHRAGNVEGVEDEEGGELTHSQYDQLKADIAALRRELEQIEQGGGGGQVVVGNQILLYAAASADNQPSAAKFLAGTSSRSGEIVTPETSQAAFLMFAADALAFGRVRRMRAEGGLSDARRNFLPARGEADVIIQIDGRQFYTYVENVKTSARLFGLTWELEPE